MRAKVFDNVTTEDAYKDSKVVVYSGPSEPPIFAFIIFWIKNTGGTNSLNFKIFASPDGVNWEELKPATSLGPGKTAYETLTEPWYALKMQVASAAAGSPTTCDAWILTRP